MKVRKWLAIEIIVAVLVVSILLYSLMPAWNLRSPFTWAFIAGLVLMISLIIHSWKSINEYELNDLRSERRRNWRHTISDQKKKHEEKLSKKRDKLCTVTRLLKIIALICFLFIPVGGFFSGRIVNADAYRNLTTIEEGSFEKDFPEADPNGINIPFVSMEIAQQLGDRTIANVESAELYEVDDEYNLIEYQGDYYRISSLSYGGILRAFNARTRGIPGYVLVNARTQEAKFCEVKGGYFYSPSALFDQKLYRHLRRQFRTAIFGEKSYFEIDEEGHPYWITEVITKTIGVFGGNKVNEIVITDAVNGESRVYKIDELPNWVDHAFLLSYLTDKANDYYGLVHGALNFSGKDVKRLSNGYTSFINENGEVCFTMGLTPANEAKSNIGFILINSRTGKIKQYIADGIQESTAQSRVETLVQNYGYKATFPQVINIEGIPTYLMCLTGGDGLIQDIALACISTSSNATAYAPTLEDAIIKYKSALRNSGAINKSPVNEESTTVEGIIKHIYSAEIEGTTYFFYVIENDEHLYKASISLNERQVLLTPGSSVKLTYNGDEDVTAVIGIEF